MSPLPLLHRFLFLTASTCALPTRTHPFSANAGAPRSARYSPLSSLLAYHGVLYHLYSRITVSTWQPPTAAHQIASPAMTLIPRRLRVGLLLLSRLLGVDLAHTQVTRPRDQAKMRLTTKLSGKRGSRRRRKTTTKSTTGERATPGRTT